MILKWKGLLSEKNSFPKNNIPINSVQFLNSKSKIKPYIAVISILIFIIAIIFFKRNFIDEFYLNIKGMLIGAILIIPFMIIHEFLHALCLPQKCIAEIFFSPAGISIIPCSPISKLNYLITLLIPFFILGLIPLLIWTFISFNNVILSSIIFIVSIANLGACSNDLYNFIEALLKMPKNSFMITSGIKCYYYEA